MLFFGNLTLCMEDESPRDELSLHHIVTFCEWAGNSELGSIYAQKYHKVKIVEQSERGYNYGIYLDNVKLYLKSLDNLEDENCKHAVIRHSKDKICALCWHLCKGKDDDSTKLVCCDHKFHIRCVVNWMAVGSKKSCPICQKDIVKSSIEALP